MEITAMLRQTREDRLSEVGTEPPCPLCGKPRVVRSDYIRCNPCAVNWLDGENLSRDPRIERQAAHMATSASRPAATTGADAEPPKAA